MYRMRSDKGREGGGREGLQVLVVQGENQALLINQDETNIHPSTRDFSVAVQGFTRMFSSTPWLLLGGCRKARRHLLTPSACSVP